MKYYLYMNSETNPLDDQKNFQKFLTDAQKNNPLMTIEAKIPVIEKLRSLIAAILTAGITSQTPVFVENTPLPLDYTEGKNYSVLSKGMSSFYLLTANIISTFLGISPQELENAKDGLTHFFSQNIPHWEKYELQGELLKKHPALTLNAIEGFPNALFFSLHEILYLQAMENISLENSEEERKKINDFLQKSPLLKTRLAISGVLSPFFSTGMGSIFDLASPSSPPLLETSIGVFLGLNAFKKNIQKIHMLSSADRKVLLAENDSSNTVAHEFVQHIEELLTDVSTPEERAAIMDLFDSSGKNDLMLLLYLILLDPEKNAEIPHLGQLVVKIGKKIQKETSNFYTATVDTLYQMLLEKKPLSSS